MAASQELPATDVSSHWKLNNQDPRHRTTTSRSWMGTSFSEPLASPQELVARIEAAPDHMGVRHACFGLETCPTTGRKHIQFCVLMQEKPRDRKCRYTHIQDVLNNKGAHCLQAHNYPNCVEYCKKEGQWAEFGSYTDERTRT